DRSFSEHGCDFAVGVTDGQTKLTIMQAIVSIVYHLELTDEELANEHLVRTLTSFRFIRVNFVYHKNPAEYHYEALRNGYLTAEKQAPSPLVLAAEMAAAIEIEQRSGKKKLPLRDALNSAVAAYNKNITVTRHRINTQRKTLINNLPLGLLNASPGLTGSLMYLSTLQDIIHHI
ncbi:unnamed protein product, partial [Symbiodinium microadriaticum]